MYGFNPLVDRPRRSRRRGVVRRRGCSSVAEQADGGELRARTKAGAAAPCWATAKLTWVSLPARPRPRSVLLCVPTPWLSSMAQPDLRLHPVRGRRLSEAARAADFDGCRRAAQGSSMGTQGSELAAPTVVPPRCVPLAGEGFAGGPDGPPWVVESGALRGLAGPPRHTTELGGLWSPCESSRVCM